MEIKIIETYFTVDIEATVKAKSEEEARRILYSLILKSKKVSSFGMTDANLKKEGVL